MGNRRGRDTKGDGKESDERRDNFQWLRRREEGGKSWTVIISLFLSPSFPSLSPSYLPIVPTTH